MTSALRDIALLIPAEYRKQILEENVIYKAVPASNDRHMSILFTIWTHYIDPGTPVKMDCPYCLADIIKNFQGLQEAFIEIAKDEAFLESL